MLDFQILALELVWRDPGRLLPRRRIVFPLMKSRPGVGHKNPGNLETAPVARRAQTVRFSLNRWVFQLSEVNFNSY